MPRSVAPPDRSSPARWQTFPRLALLLLPLLAPSALEGQTWEEYDYEDLEFSGIGLEAGRVWPASVEPTAVYGLRMDLGFIGPRVRISPSTRFWSSRLQEGEVIRLADQILLVCERQVGVECPDRLDLGEVRLSDLEMAVDGHFFLLPGRTISPFLGASLALHLLNGQGDFIDGTFVEDLLDTVSPGVGPILGVDITLGRSIRLGAEARFMLASDVRYASVAGGVVWTLPVPRGVVESRTADSGDGR